MNTTTGSMRPTQWWEFRERMTCNIRGMRRKEEERVRMEEGKVGLESNISWEAMLNK